MQRIVAPPPLVGLAEQMALHGQFRVRLFNQAEFERLSKKHPDWPREYILALCVDDDSGWVKNTVTDFGRQLLHFGGITTNVDLFIHEAAVPGDIDRTSINFIYPSQVPSQVANPVNVLDGDTLVQTRTQTFTAPAVTRNINSVGLTLNTGASVADGHLHAVVAYSKLPSTRVQTTVQTADVQYRLTWSFQ